MDGLQLVRFRQFGALKQGQGALGFAQRVRRGATGLVVEVRSEQVEIVDQSVRQRVGVGQLAHRLGGHSLVQVALLQRRNEHVAADLSAPFRVRAVAFPQNTLPNALQLGALRVVLGGIATVHGVASGLRAGVRVAEVNVIRRAGEAQAGEVRGVVPRRGEGVGTRSGHGRRQAHAVGGVCRKKENKQKSWC